MIVVKFKKDFAETALDAIRNGKPIPAPDDAGWTQPDMLTLAGVLYAAIFSHGPVTYAAAGLPSDLMNKLPTERREAVQETLGTDIHDGIEFVSGLAFQVMDDEYEHGDELHGIVYTKGDGGKGVMPVKGFKGHKDMM